VYAEPGKATPESARDAITALERAVADIKAGLVDTLVTGPINKKAMSVQGFGFPGHTEFLQQSFGVGDVAMLMTSHRLKLAGICCLCHICIQYGVILITTIGPPIICPIP
jgi:4-hydroxythreonine-4-phosphate dehydrogenase